MMGVPPCCRRKAVFAAIVGGLLLGGAGSAEADSIRSRLTRKDDMNAVRAFGRTWTIHDLIEFRAQAPGRFDANNRRLGSALRLGLEGLEARRALNPGRFDLYHPVLGYLLADSGPRRSDLGQAAPPPVGTGPGGEIETPAGPSPSPPSPPGPIASPPPVTPPTIAPPGVIPPETTLPELPPVDPPTPPTSIVSPPTSSGGDGSPPGGSGPGGSGPTDPPGPGPEPGPTPGLGDPYVIPEPSAMLQLAVGLGGLGGLLAWRRRGRGRRASS